MALVNRKAIRDKKAEQERQKQLAYEQAKQARNKPKSNPYRKELKTKQPTVKTRSSENEKQRETSSFLNKAILIVLALLVLVMLAVFFL